MTEGELFALLAERARSGVCPQLGIVGGTFDPIHVGHVAMGEACLGELGLDAVLYIPAGNPHFKQGRTMAPARDRLAMAELAAGMRPRSAVSACEVVRPGITYTADTLLWLAGRCPSGTRLTFAVGADAFATLPTWHRAADIARFARIAVFERAGIDPADARRRVEESGLGFETVWVRTRIPTVSSTQVRDLLERGEDASAVLDAAVERYIGERGLYGFGTTHGEEWQW